MELIRGLHNLRDAHRPSVATIGNFDGVHLGHQAVIGQLLERSAESGLPSTVILFEPQPREYFQGEAAPARLSTLGEKLERIQELGVDRLLCLHFNERLRSLSGDEFIRQVLVDGINVRHLVVGDDFRFGCDRKGDYKLLSQRGKDFGYSLESTASCMVGGKRVSSTALREALDRGDLETAFTLLNCAYRISGRVSHGARLGRTIDVPTANVLLKRRRIPLHGVFVVEVSGNFGDSVFKGIANVGTRPTVGGTHAVLEAHLFDFSGDLYGARLHVDFLHRIRDEQHFADFAGLRAQILLDLEHARDWLASRPA